MPGSALGVQVTVGGSQLDPASAWQLLLHTPQAVGEVRSRPSMSSILPLQSLSMPSQISKPLLLGTQPPLPPTPPAPPAPTVLDPVEPPSPPAPVVVIPLLDEVPPQPKQKASVVQP